MDRRGFLGLCVAGAGTLAGCPARSQDAGSGAEPDGATGDTPTETDTATPVPPVDGSWESYQHDAANTGTTAETGPTDDPAERWRRTAAAGRPATPPTAADGAFVVVSTAGTLYARDAADGSVRWIGDRTVGTDVPPVVADATAVAVDRRTLVGVSTEAGRERWTASLDGPVAGLAAADGRVVVATQNGISAVSAADGTRQWHHQTEEEVLTPPGAGEGTVAVGLSSGEVLAVDAGTGERRWRASVGAEPAFAPAVGNGSVSVAAGSRLVVLDGDGGERRWDQQTDAPVAAGPVVTSDAVHVATIDDDADGQAATPSSGEGTPTPTPHDVRWFEGSVLALSPDEGRELWRASRTERYSFTSGPPEELPLARAGDRVLVNLGGTLVAYDAGGAEAWSARAGSVTPAVTAGIVSTGTVGIGLETGSRRWRLRTGDGTYSAPAVVGNTLYVGSDDNYLYAMAANTGGIEWAARTDDVIRSAPAVGDDAVYVGTINGSLYAFDRADGAELWSAAVGGQIRAPALHDGTLYVGTFSQTVHAVDAADGTVAWRTEVDADRFVALEVAVADGAVYAGANGDLRAFEAADGAERWSAVFGDRARVQSPPAAADGRVFVNIGEALRAFDTADGTEVWSAPIAGNANEPPVVQDGVVYTSSDEAVHAVDAADGTERWRTSSVGSTLAMAATDDAIYGRGHDTPLVALDPENGDWLWRDRSFEPGTPLAVADGHLFVGDRSGSVRALGPDTG